MPLYTIIAECAGASAAGQLRAVNEVEAFGVWMEKDAVDFIKELRTFLGSDIYEGWRKTKENLADHEDVTEISGLKNVFYSQFYISEHIVSVHIVGSNE